MRYLKISLAIVLISMLVFGSTMSAFAAPYNVTVAVNAGSAGKGTVTGSNTYEEGTPVSITATPVDGYQFSKWVITCVNATTESTNPNYTFSMHSHAVAVEAYFKDKTYNIITEVNDPLGGSVTGGGVFNYTQNVNIVATAAPGYHFDKWLADFGDGNYIAPPFTTASFTCNLEHCGNGYFPVVKLKAFFVADNPDPGFDVSVLVEDEVGWGTVTGAGSYEEGALVTLTAIPTMHYYLDDWGGPESVDPTFNGMLLTFNMPGEDVVITAFFKEHDYIMATVQYVDMSDVVIKTETQEKVYVGAYTLTPPAISGYTFSSSTANASGTITAESPTFTVIHKYAVASTTTEPTTETTTQPVTQPATVETTEDEPEDDVVTTTTTAPATTEATTEPTTEATTEAAIEIVTEEVPLAPVIIDVPTTEGPSDVILDEEVPLADALPQTGNLSIDYFYGIGGLISGLGLWLKRRK